jgi:hypothetical protein
MFTATGMKGDEVHFRVDWLDDTHTKLLNYLTFLEEDDANVTQHNLTQFCRRWEKYEEWLRGKVITVASY